MKKMFALLAIMVISVCLVACKNDDDKNENKGHTINLTYSGTASDQEFNEKLFEKFKEARKAAGDPNTYVIKYIAHGPDKVDSEILDWKSNNAPDVFEAASDKIAILYQKGALAKLPTAYANYIDAEMSSMGKTLSMLNGEYYAYPYTGDNTYYLQYDKSVFTEEDVKSMEGLLAAANAKGVQVGYDLETAFWGGAAMFTFGADYDLTYDLDGNLIETECDFNSEKGLKAAKAIFNIMKDPAWVNTSGVPASDSLTKAVIAGTWSVAAYKEALGENYGVAVMPTVTVDGETKNLGCFLGGKFFGVNPQRSAGDAERLTAAHELAKFLSGAECQTARYEEANIYPCNVNAQNHPLMATDANVQVLKAQSEFAHAQTAVPDTFWNAPAALTGGIKDGTYTLENLQDAIDAFNSAVKNEQGGAE